MIGRREDVLSLLLIENLQREDLNPIDMAKGLRSLFQARQGDVSLDEILNVLQTHERDRNRLPQDVVFTVNTIAKIYGKSKKSLKRLFAFLKLPDHIKRPCGRAELASPMGIFFYRLSGQSGADADLQRPLSACYEVVKVDGALKSGLSLSVQNKS
jgi:hypothetical protein